MPYHIKITQKSFTHSEYEFDLTKQKINTHYLTPLREDDSVIINGRVIPFDDVAQVKILKTDKKSFNLRLPVTISLNKESDEFKNKRLWDNLKMGTTQMPLNQL